MTNDNGEVTRSILNTKRKLEEELLPSKLEKVIVYLSPQLAKELKFEEGEIVGTFAGRPVEVAIVQPYPIINLDEAIDADFGKVFVEAQTPMGPSQVIQFSKDLQKISRRKHRL